MAEVRILRLSQPLRTWRRAVGLYRQVFRVPWTVHRYILLEIIKVLLISMFALSVLSMAVFTYRVVHLQGFSVTHVWPLLLKLFYYPLFYSVPISLLFGATLGLGRMVADREVTALRASGVSYIQLFFPAIVLGAALSIVSNHMNGYVVPEVHYAKRNLRQYVLRELKNLGAGRDRRIPISEGTKGFCSVYARRYDGNRLFGLVIQTNQLYPETWRHLVPSEWDYPAVITADEGEVNVSEDEEEIVLRITGTKIHLETSRIKDTRKAAGKIGDAVRKREPFLETIQMTEVPLRLPLREFRRRAKDLTNPDLDKQEEEYRQGILEGKQEARRGIAALGGGGLTEEEVQEITEALFNTRDPRPAVERLTARYAPAAAGQGEEDGLQGRLRTLFGAIAGETPDEAEFKRWTDLVLISSSRWVEIDKLRTERHYRYAFSASCLSFLAIGLPLPLLLNRRSRLVPFFFGNLIAIVVFYPLIMLGTNLGERGIVPELSMALPNLAMLAVGGFLFAKLRRR